MTARTTLLVLVCVLASLSARGGRLLADDPPVLSKSPCDWPSFCRTPPPVHPTAQIIDSTRPLG